MRSDPKSAFNPLNLTEKLTLKLNLILGELNLKHIDFLQSVGLDASLVNAQIIDDDAILREQADELVFFHNTIAQDPQEAENYLFRIAEEIEPENPTWADSLRDANRNPLERLVNLHLMQRIDLAECQIKQLSEQPAAQVLHPQQQGNFVAQDPQSGRNLG